MAFTHKYSRLHNFLLFSMVAVFIWSFIGCFDLFTWLLEVLPVIAALAVLVYVYPRFCFTNFTYILIWVHIIILLIGAHYTYARMPLFNWIRDTFELSRNHYDRLGHIAQGFFPAIIAREVLLRKSPLRKGRWLFFIIICVCLSISAGYELLEWIAAVISRDGAVAFLATQGDQWDTQKDMALCLLGAVVSLLVLTKPHNRALEKLLKQGEQKDGI
ncbi:MAG: DUF2238 domain-containing protein [Planctomycetota bacterium]|jgi:putative membrane protein